MTLPGTAHPATLQLDFEGCYRAIAGRDTRWDGRIYLGVSSTGIYCRPSCPARKPKPENCRFFPSAAACVAAGFRACKRCRPDSLPGTRDWDARGDLAARAVRRIRDGAVDIAGVGGLARELAVSERHLHRVLVEQVGAGPLQLARTRRAHAARALIEQTDLPLTDIAFAAGFGSVRQFGDTMREEFGVAPSQLPRARSGAARTTGEDRHAPGRSAPAPASASASAGAQGATEPISAERPVLALTLRTRTPYDSTGVRSFLAAHAVPGRDQVDGSTTSHALDVPGGIAIATIDWSQVRERAGWASLPVRLELPGLADVTAAISVVRRLLDLDADPAQIAAALGGDRTLAPLLQRRPGLRLPGARHPAEFALGVVLGQQVSLAAARTLQGRLAREFQPEARRRSSAAPAAPEQTDSAPWLAAPDIARIAATQVDELRARIGLNRGRAEALRLLAAAIDAGLDLGPGADRNHARTQLAAIRGVGPWTVELIAMRALGDPDAYPAGDLILRRALGTRTDRDTRAVAEAWRPYRGYATQHLWADFLAAQAAATRTTPDLIRTPSRRNTHEPGTTP